MDVSPHELRDSEIPATFRGYNPEAVDDLLERAASTIESMADRVRDLSDRVNQLEAVAGGAPAPAPASAPTSGLSAQQAEEQMQEAVRALVLAQRTADETVSEAHSRAQQMLADAEARQQQIIEQARQQVADAEAHAQQLVDQATEEARREGESERARVAQEARDLAAAREALQQDVTALEDYASSLRAQLRTTIEQHRDASLAVLEEHRGALQATFDEQLRAIDQGADTGLRAPQLHDVTVPEPAAPVPAAPIDLGGDRTQEFSAFDADALATTEPEPADFGVGGGGFDSSSFATYDDPFTAPASDTVPTTGADSAFGVNEPAPSFPSFDEGNADDPFGVFGGTGSGAGAGAGAPGATPPAFDTFDTFEQFESFNQPTSAASAPAAGAADAWMAGEEPQAGSDALDDDAFFASLREAVSDDAPLGPAAEPKGDDNDDFGDVFGRRS